MKTERTSRLPLLYTHVIGSLPRPKVLRDLVAQRETMDPREYQDTMDDMVLFAIRLQERAGLDAISDGEWRRSHYIRELFRRVGGTEPVLPYEHQGETKYTDVIVRRMEAKDPVYAQDAAFLAKHTNRCRKYALPSPFLVAVRYWHEGFSEKAYPTMQHFMDHLAEILAGEARAMVEAGIDIIQLDDPALTYFCDRKLMELGETHDNRLKRAWNVDRQLPEAVAAYNRITEGLEAEIHLHCCHSVYKRKSDVTGDYRPILPRLEQAHVDRINLEFAYQGTGSVGDLDLLPAHLDVGMGVVDVRGEQLQTVEQIEAIAAAGIERIGPKRIALNPDCGFAPDAGEPPTVDEAYEKLRRMVEAATRLRAKYAVA